MSKNVYFQLADSQMHFPIIRTPQIWKYFPNMVGYTELTENSTKILGRDGALRALPKFELLGW